MRKVAVIGCNGAGKTTVAYAIARRDDLPLIHLDSLYYRGAATVPAGEWAALQRELVTADAWVIDGNYASTLPIRLAEADTVVLLDLPTRSCLAGIARRRLRHRGRSQPELGVHDRVSWQFLRYVCGFRRRRRPGLLRLLERHAGDADVIRLTNRRAARRFCYPSRGSSTSTGISRVVRFW